MQYPRPLGRKGHGASLRALLAGLALTLLPLPVRAAAPTVPAAPRLAVANDFDGDGRSDILWRNAATGQVYLMPMNGANVLPGAVVTTQPDPNVKLAGTGDFDGDGRTDLLWWNSLTGEVTVTLVDGATVKSQSVIYTEPDTMWQIQAVADFTGDGQADILWRHTGTGEIYLMPVAGGVVQPGFMLPQENRYQWKIVGAADFDGDGRADILWWNSISGEVCVKLMGDGGTIKSEATVYTANDTRWMIAGVGDFDGDGKADILWRNQTTGEVYQLLMDGLQVKVKGHVYTEANLDWVISAIGDYDGDGKADIFWLNGQTGQAYLQLMDGASIRFQGMLDTGMGASWACINRARPAISLFKAAQGLVTIGDPLVLTAYYTGGTGVIDPGGIPVASGGQAVVYPGSSAPLTDSKDSGPLLGELLKPSPILTQTYTLTVTSPDGTTASYRTSVQMVPGPIRPVITAPTYLTTAHTATASVPTQDGCTFTWSIRGGTFAGGDVVASGATVSLTAGSPGPLYLTCFSTNLDGASVTGDVKLVTVVAMPAISSYAAAPDTVTLLDSSILSFTFTGGTGSIDRGLFSSSVTSPGSLNVSPLATRDFPLTVTNLAGDSVTQAVTVTVVARPTISTFTGPGVVQSGGSVTLSAQFGNGTGMITPGNLAITSGTGLVIPGVTQDTTYTLTVTNLANTSVTRTTAVTVVAGPTLTASNTSLVLGQAAVLVPTFTGTVAHINPGAIAVSNGVGVTVTPSASTAYTLTVDAVDSAPLTVTVSNYLPKFVYVANSGTSISAFTLNTGTGALSAIGGSPYSAAAQQVASDGQGRFLFVASGGDGVRSYLIDGTSGVLTGAPNSPVALASTTCTSVATDPMGRFVFVSGADNTLHAYRVDQSTGELTAAGSPVPIGAIGKGDLIVHPSGRFLYAVLTADKIDAYGIDQGTGALTQISGAPFATGTLLVSSAAIDPTGANLFVGCTKLVGGNLLSAYSINLGTGALTLEADSPISSLAALPAAHGMVFHPTQSVLYTAYDPAIAKTTDLAAYTLNIAGGVLAAMTGSPYDLFSSHGSEGVTIERSGQFAFATGYKVGSIRTMRVDGTGLLTRLSGAALASSESQDTTPVATHPVSIAVAGTLAEITGD